MNQSLTTGRIVPTLIKFALPYIFSIALQSLYGAADLIVVGQFSSETSTSSAVAAVAIGGQIMNLLTMLILGITTGATVLIAKFVGAKDEDNLAKAIGNTILIFLTLAIIITPILLLSNNSIVSLLKTPAEAISFTEKYLFISSLGLPLIIGYNVVSGIFRGLGDSKTPLIFIAISCGLNIGLDILLVAVFHMGPSGAALATIFSQGIAFISSLIYMKFKRFYFDFTRNHLHFSKDIVGKIFKVGLPVALQDTLISLSFLIITAFVNTMGVDESAAVGVVGRLLGFLFIPQTAFAASISTISSQNIGAGKVERSFKSLYYGIGFSLIYAIITFIYAQINPGSLIAIFTSDPDVIYNGGLYLKSFSLDFILVCFIFSMNNFFGSFNKAIFSMAHSLIATFFVRIPITWYVSQMENGTLLEMGWAAPLSSLFSLVSCVIFFLILKKKTIG